MSDGRALVDFVPADLGGWDEVDSVCPGRILVAVAGGEPQRLRCENDAGHQPPCSVTLTWATPTGD